MLALAALLALPVAASRLGMLAQPAFGAPPLAALGNAAAVGSDDATMPTEVVAQLSDGDMAPDRVPAVAAAALALVVTGDGTPRTLAIPGIVAAEPIAPHGETVVRFALPPGSDDRPILLDGRSVAALVIRPWIDPDR